MIEIVFLPVVLEGGSDVALSWFTALCCQVTVWLGLFTRRAIGAAAAAAVAVAASTVVMTSAAMAV